MSWPDSRGETPPGSRWCRAAVADIIKAKNLFGWPARAGTVNGMNEPSACKGYPQGRTVRWGRSTSPLRITASSQPAPRPRLVAWTAPSIGSACPTSIRRASSPPSSTTRRAAASRIAPGRRGLPPQAFLLAGHRRPRHAVPGRRRRRRGGRPVPRHRRLLAGAGCRSPLTPAAGGRWSTAPP